MNLTCIIRFIPLNPVLTTSLQNNAVFIHFESENVINQIWKVMRLQLYIFVSFFSDTLSVYTCIVLAPIINNNYSDKSITVSETLAFFFKYWHSSKLDLKAAWYSGWFLYWRLRENWDEFSRSSNHYFALCIMPHLYVMRFKENSRNSHMWHFQFPMWLKCSFRDVNFAENPTWIGPAVPRLWAIERFSEHRKQ